MLLISWLLLIRIYIAKIKLTAPKCNESTEIVSREVHLISMSNLLPCQIRTRGLKLSINWQDIRIAWICACLSPNSILLRVSPTKARRRRCIGRRDLHRLRRNLRSKDLPRQVHDRGFMRAWKASEAKKFWPAPIKPSAVTTQYLSKTIQWLSCMMKLMRRLWSQMWIWETLWLGLEFTRLR